MPHNFGVRREVDRKLPPIMKMKPNGIRVIVCRARLVCGHVVHREHEIRRAARCFECRS